MQLFKPVPPVPPPPRQPGQPWRLAEAATYLRVSVRTLSRMSEAGQLRITRLGARVLVPDAEVQRLASPAPLSPATVPTAVALHGGSRHG